MSRLVKMLLIGNAVLLVWNLFGATGRAQLPPQTNQDGVPFFKVNINPTDIPPAVNINPDRLPPPKIEVSRMPDTRVVQIPDIKVIPAGCSSRQNFQTSVGRLIAGPMIVTYLNAPPQVTATLADDRNGSQSIVLQDSRLATAIYLRAGQRLEFQNNVMYSGCQPE